MPARAATPIRGPRVLLRPLAGADLPWLREAARQPSVAAWWDVGTGVGWVDEVLADDDVVPYVVEAAGQAIGFVQWSEERDPGYRCAWIDLFIVDGAQGAGYGREVVRTLAQWLVEQRGHHRIEIDPAADNVRAIRAYEAVGFRPIGVARRRERTVDGGWPQGHEPQENLHTRRSALSQLAALAGLAGVGGPARRQGGRPGDRPRGSRGDRGRHRGGPRGHP